MMGRASNWALRRALRAECGRFGNLQLSAGPAAKSSGRLLQAGGALQLVRFRVGRNQIALAADADHRLAGRPAGVAWRGAKSCPLPQSESAGRSRN